MKEKLIHVEEAFAALQKGEEKGLDFFFNQFYAPLVMFSRSITGNKALSQEIVSDSFIKLWNNRENLAQAGTIKALLYRMVHNASIDFLRETKSYRQRAQVLTLYQNNEECSVLEKMVEAETYHKLYLLLSHLPPRCAEIFRMFYFQDKAIKEIAQELGISVNTVKTQKQRALQMLRDKSIYLSMLLIMLRLFF